MACAFNYVWEPEWPTSEALGSNAWKFNKLLLNRRLEFLHTEDAFGRSLDILKFRFLS
ncbi:hypothetical protein KP509_30G004900 [Ceratopteris richardii]|uniref:Uncharacterized protein n=1 Tax=Ceratopteris richardii TaxID=49495 RepID=A0A8T2R187_CERRI|nr:hypothetical protein KP509_30G004900 [Ceratopteris richardii]